MWVCCFCGCFPCGFHSVYIRRCWLCFFHYGRDEIVHISEILEIAMHVENIYCHVTWNKEWDITLGIRSIRDGRLMFVCVSSG